MDTTPFSPFAHLTRTERLHESRFAVQNAAAWLDGARQQLAVAHARPFARLLAWIAAGALERLDSMTHAQEARVSWDEASARITAFIEHRAGL